MNALRHHIAAVEAALKSATSPAAIAAARRDGLALVDELDRRAANAFAHEAIRKAQAAPQSMVGAWLSKTERDRPVFFLGRGGTRLKGSVELPNGQKVLPNDAGQVVVPWSMSAAMIARGFVRANDEGKTRLDPLLPMPRNPNAVGV